jgi:hypothetical protein
MTIMETAVGSPDGITIAERKLEELKQINGNFSTYYAVFQHDAANVQWNNSTKCTALM